MAHAKVHLEGTPANSDDSILHLDGATDDTGTFAINAKVPIYFFDRVTHGTDTMRWVAVVTDTANHAEQTSGNVTIAADPLIVEAIPESGFLRPGLSNIVYLQVSLPDGSPVSAKLQINTDSAKQLIETDAAGLATFTMTSPLIGDVPVTVTAQVRDIKHTQTIKLGSTGTHASVLLRPERLEYKAGEPIQVQYFVSGGAKTLYLDVAKDRQTLDFRALVLKDGAGSTTLNIDPALLGTLEVHAYALGPNGEVASDRRLVLINAPPAAMNLSLDAEQYAPGGKAKLKIDVARAGQSIPAALGVSIVDESVFAVGAQDPAFVRTYFLLQQELLQRRYGLSGFAPFEDSQPQQISAGIERSNQLALAGAMAQELAASPTAVPITAPTMTPVAQTQTDALIAGLGGRALFMLPLIGMLFYDHRRRRNRIMLATMIGLAVMGTVLMGCAPAAAPAAPAASRVEAPAPEGAIAMGAAPIVEAAAPRLRQFFPETLMWLPDLNTDANGHAEIEVPLADSITTWRVSVVASGKDGTLGSASTSLRVFQDFFIEPTLPKQLTQNDEVEIPVSIYNYLKEPQTVEIAVQTADWFELAADKQTQQVALNPGDVTLIKLPIKVSKPGEHSINLTAKGSHMSDAIQKTLTVLPDGRKLIEKRAGTLARSVEESIELPKDVLSGTDRLSVGIAPAAIGAFPLNVPNEFWTSDCFYSDIGAIHPIATLAQYLKAKGQLIPEQQIRAEKLLQIGVQRLMRYYDPRSGGFSNDCHLIVRGKASASATAIALVALSDMQRVVYVDPAVIAGASNYLVNTQKPDGTWPLPEDDGYFYFCGAPAPAPDRAQTVAIAAALAESGLAKGQAAQRAMGYLRENGDKLTDAHSQALFANALLLADSNDALARRMLDMLLKQTSVSNGERLWTQSGYTYLDTTAIAALALLRSGRYTDEAQEALAGLRTHFGNEGYYIADPARVNMLRALLLDADLHPSRGSAEVAIQLNNTNVGNISITPENALVTQQKDWANELQPGTNSIQLRTRGDAVLRYQIQAEYYVPRGSAEAETLDMRMTYSTQQLKLNGSVNLVVSVINHAKTRSGPLIAEIRLPAGFVLLSENLPSLQTSGQNASFVFSGNGIVIGLSDLQPDQEMQLPSH